MGQGITWAVCFSEDVLWCTGKGVPSYLELKRAGFLCAIKWMGVVFAVAGEPATREPEKPGRCWHPGWGVGRGCEIAEVLFESKHVR